MIVRSWRGRASREKVHLYVEHARKRVFPQLEAIKGHKGALLLREDRKDDVEVHVLTFWESMDAIIAFAGAAPETAVVEPEAEAVLIDYDRTVQHYELVANSGRPLGA
ncbi:MAG: antibiotic biosynthesis monooxygenase [Bacteroidota bacterium]|jgi:heme-degrading monooxygenase HmoA